MRNHGRLGAGLIILSVALVGCDPTPPDPGACTITGTAGNDRLVGTEGSDVICGSDGRDWIVGLGGNDQLVGGPGDDEINPGDGDDLVWGESGDDSVHMQRVPGGEQLASDGLGKDTVYLGDGADDARTGAGDDVVKTGPNDKRPHLAESVRAGDGNDRIYMPTTSQGALNGDAGNDYLEAHSDHSVMFGGPGNDVGFHFLPGAIMSFHGDSGSDLAVLLDGTMDQFQAGEEPSGGLPVPGTPCTFQALGESIGVACARLGEIGGEFDSDGNFTYTAALPGVSAELENIAGGGGVDLDTCYCDPNIAGWPMAADVLL